MAELRFGTDGVRGRAFDELTLDLAFGLGEAAARRFSVAEAVVGRDPRESGPALVDALAAGLAAGGVEARDLGIVPTPGVAHAAARRGAIGVMVSASHNPWFDNGIKFFTPTGSKLTDADQAAIEAALPTSPRNLSDSARYAGTNRQITGMEEVRGWVDHVKKAASGDFGGLRVVIDTANGAASHVVAPALADLGADVTAIANRPDGRNINDACGSTDTTALAAAVVAQSADLGIALDGDADRLVAVDHRGSVVDGDRLMAILALDLRDRGQLRDDTLVVTVMSNLGLHRAMADAGIAVEITPVGDRHILEALAANRWSFGGEQSGHLIFADLATTGDGFLSAVQLLGVVVRRQASLADMADAAMDRYPQILRNVATTRRVADPATELETEIAEIEAELGAEGRVLLRASGTEPVIRVMIEAADETVAQDHTDRLVHAVERRFGA